MPQSDVCGMSPHKTRGRGERVSKILRNATSYNRAQLGVLEGCPLVMLGRVWEGLAPSKKMVVGLLQKLRYILHFALHVLPTLSVCYMSTQK